MKETVKFIVAIVCVAFSLLYFFTPIGDKLNSLYQHFLPKERIDTNWTGAVQTNSWVNQSGDTIGVIPIQETFIRDDNLSIEENISWALTKGKEGIDYITIIPAQQPNINGDINKNNKNIWTYNYQYKSEFTIPLGKTNWYLVFELNNDLELEKWDSRGFYLGVWGKTLGMVSSKNLWTSNKTYIFDMKDINLKFPDSKVNLFNKLQDNKIQLSAIVAKTWVFIKRITLVFCEPIPS